METWTPALETKIRSGTSKTNRGSSCYFVELTPTTGLKLYGTKLERDASYVALSIAAEHGLAPKVGQTVELDNLNISHGAPAWWPEDFKPKTLYGFLTEIAHRPICDGRDFYVEVQDLENALYDVFQRQIDDINAPCNCGRLANGRLVAIDIDGRFSGLLTQADIKAINKEWGGSGLQYWNVQPTRIPTVHTSDKRTFRSLLGCIFNPV